MPFERDAARSRFSRLARRVLPRSPLSLDPLTGLATRALLERALLRRAGSRRPAGKRRPDLAAACLLVDVVGLKAANAAGGFSCGDALLRLAADRLRAIAPSARLLARLGGDELVALFTGPAAHEQAADACRLAVEAGTPSMRAAWGQIEPGEPPAVLLDRLYAGCRGIG